MIQDDLTCYVSVWTPPWSFKVVWSLAPLVPLAPLGAGYRSPGLPTWTAERLARPHRLANHIRESSFAAKHTIRMAPAVGA